MDYQITEKSTLSSTNFKNEITQDNESLPSNNNLQQFSKPLNQNICNCCHHGCKFNHETSPLLLQQPRSPEPSWCPPSPPWNNPTSHNPSLLYCCISSLRHEGGIHSIVTSGTLVLTGSSSTRIHAWPSLDCHAKGYVQASSGEVRAMVAHGDMLFTSHKDHKIRVWNVRTSSGELRPSKVTTLPSSGYFTKSSLICRAIAVQHKDIISCMAYYHVEGILYTGSFDKTVKVWKLNERKCVESFLAHGGNINNMVINQINGHLFTCSSDGTVKVWFRVYGEFCHTLIKVLSFQTSPIYALALSVTPSQRSFLYSGSSDGCINFWVQKFSLEYSHGGVLEGHQFAVLCLVALENLVISGSEDSTIRIWRRDKERVVNHECLAILEGHKGPVRCLATYLPKEDSIMSFFVYSGSLDETFKVWRVKLLREAMKPPLENRTTGDNDVDEGSSTSSPVLSPSWVKKKLQCRSPH